MVTVAIIYMVFVANVIKADAFIIQHSKGGASNPCGQNSTNTGPLICQPWDKTVEDLVPRLTGISDEAGDIIAQNYDFPVSFTQLLPSNITGLLLHADKAKGDNLTKHDGIPFLTFAFDDFTTLGNYLKLVIQGLPEGHLKSSYASVHVHIMDLINAIHVGLRGLGGDIPDDTSDENAHVDVSHTKCIPCRDFQLVRDLKDIVEYFKDKLQNAKPSTGTA